MMWVIRTYCLFSAFQNNYAAHALLSSEAEADAYVKANDLGSSVTEIESMLAGASQRLLHKPRVERPSVRPLIKKLQVAEQEAPSKQQAAVSEGFNGAKSFHDASSPHSGENLGPPAHTEMIAGDSLQQEIKQV
jgi:hypothetical protein